MRFVVVVENRPGTDDARKALHSAHLDYIAAHPEVLIAGSVHGGDRDPKFEGLWVVEAKDREAVHVLMEAEPFCAAGHRAAIHIYEFVPPPMFDYLFQTS
ncbi:MAG: hypothetical protein KKH72_09470 [Alphaproteobacteria bacterium]|nr:hypothetical protein [Alphaproteobacteria bacterium]